MVSRDTQPPFLSNYKGLRELSVRATQEEGHSTQKEEGVLYVSRETSSFVFLQGLLWWSSHVDPPVNWKEDVQESSGIQKSVGGSSTTRTLRLMRN